MTQAALVFPTDVSASAWDNVLECGKTLEKFISLPGITTQTQPHS